MNEKLPDISPSMRRAWRDCGRKVYYRYVAAIEAKMEKKAFAIGTAYHKGIEIWRNHRFDAEAKHNALAVAIQGFREETMGYLGAQEMNTTISQISAYIMNYPWADVNGTLDQELPVFPEDDGEIGFVDCLYTDLQGKRWIIEDKSAGMFTDAGQFFRSLQFNDQVLTYALAMHDYGKPVEGILYRQVLKTRTSQKKSEDAQEYAERIMEEYQENPNKYYREFRIETPKEKLLKWRFHKDRFNTDILSFFDVYDIEKWPFNPDNCVGMYGPCEYLALCSEGKDTKGLYRNNKKDPLDGGTFRTKIFKSKGSVNEFDTQEASKETVPTL